jgi:hypothetical protein
LTSLTFFVSLLAISFVVTPPQNHVKIHFLNVMQLFAPWHGGKMGQKSGKIWQL